MNVLMQAATPFLDKQEDLILRATLASCFFKHVKQVPAKTAIVCDGVALSYADLAILVCRWSHGLLLNGVKRGEHIGVILPNCIEFVALILVAADLGVVLVPVSTSLSKTAIQTAFAAADVKHVVANSTVYRNLFGEDSGCEILGVDGLWLSIDEECSFAVSLARLLSAIPMDVTNLNLGQGSDTLILTMTSGSTGNPKPIILSQLTKLNRVCAAVELYNITRNDITLTATPLYHSLAERLVLISLLTGGTSVLLTKFSPNIWLSSISCHSVTFTIAVSSQLKQIVTQIRSNPASVNHIASVRCIVSSSALLEYEVKSDLMKYFSCDFHECYGTSEIAIASNLNGVASIKLHSVGNAAPGVDILIIGNNDEVLTAGEAGEIVCRTPMLFGGYFKQPELTKNAMWGDYFRTGDTGKLDAEGFLYFLGRCKDIIVSGGINIYPADIESVVERQGSVRESAAFAFPDDRLGEVVALAIVPSDAQTFNLRTLRLYCGQQLADFQQPRHFFIIDELPRNGMGKLMKFALAKQFHV